MSCCDPNGLNAIFRGGYVEGEKRDFLRKGLSKRQRRFWIGLELSHKSVLDIGCGIGALGLGAVQKGAEHAFLIDVSTDYLAAAQSLKTSLNLDDKVSIERADFASLSEPPVADIVVLDRVVCCYPDASKLLSRAAEQSRESLLFSYPRPAWFMRWGCAVLNSAMALFKKDYRFYLHSEAVLRKAASAYGHSLKRREQLGIWTLLEFSLE